VFLHKGRFEKYRGLSRNQIPLEVVLDRPGLRYRARVSFEWYPDGTAHCDWIPYPSYYGFPRIGGSMTYAASRYDVSCVDERAAVRESKGNRA
jgi:hypothetical protein